jgi:SAM-dependent MidA family methyltransferase
VTLSERLRRRIAREGPISFQDFMEAALYDPAEGFYARGPRIGEGGEFATSPTISPLFARTIATAFRRDAQDFDGTIDFVEIGSGAGLFLEQFSESLSRAATDFAGRVRLTAVERTAAGRDALLERGALRGVRVFASAGELPERSVTGWIFSNELYDALPVARVRGNPAGLEEMRVDVSSNGFCWSPVPASETLRSHLAAFDVALAPGQVAEVSLLAAPLHRALARALARGALVAFDYGHRSRILYHSAARFGGTLAVHSAGRRGGNPLERPGEVDLTAHVNWDDLVRAGEQEGLTTVGVVRQGRYLTEAGLFDHPATEAEKWRAFRLVDPEGMGEELSVLVQRRASG